MIARLRLLPLPVLLLLALWGCASVLPVPAQQWVTLKTSTATRYYSVRGTTTGEIFNAIDGNGLFEQSGEHAVGLTASQWKMVWRVIDTGALCSPPSTTITLDLIVTLPQHDQMNDLPEDTRTQWQRFVARVAAHEQRHVDIYVDGANALKARMEAMLTKWSSCTELEKTLRSLWASQRAETEKAQEQFHVEATATMESDRRPLQAQIDGIQARLAAMNSEIQSLDLTRDNLRRQLDVTRARIDAVTAELAKSDGSRPHCLQARATNQVQALCQQYNGFVAAHNGLVEEHNEITHHRDRLAEEHNALLGVINGLIGALNWTR